MASTVSAALLQAVKYLKTYSHDFNQCDNFNASVNFKHE